MVMSFVYDGLSYRATMSYSYGTDVPGTSAHAGTGEHGKLSYEVRARVYEYKQTIDDRRQAGRAVQTWNGFDVSR